MRITLLALMTVLPGLAQQYLVSTVAGGAPIQTPIAALKASIYPGKVTADNKGNVYFVSGPLDYPAVYKLDGTGTITRVAGTGSPVPSPDPVDGSLATSGQITAAGLAVDRDGNLYLSDNYRIRKVTPGGIISTFAGTGRNVDGGDGGPAINASFGAPEGLDFDAAGNLYVADFYRIRKISTDGTVTTIAGNGVSGYTGDGGPATSASLSLSGASILTVGPSGDVYFVAAYELKVREVSVDGTISTIAGSGKQGMAGDGGPAAQAQLVEPNGIAIDPAGNLLIADDWVIRQVSPSGVISTVAGTTPGFLGDGGPASAAGFYNIGSMHFDGSGNLYLGDVSNARIRRIGSNGIVTSVAGNGFRSFSGDGGPALDAQLYTPEGVAVDSAGNLYIADTFNCEVRFAGADGVIHPFAGTGTCGKAFDGQPAATSNIGTPYGIAIGRDNSVYIGDGNNSCVWKVTPDGIIHRFAGGTIRGTGGDGGPATAAALVLPAGLALDSAGNLYIADEGAGQIRKVDLKGIISTIAGNGTRGFSGDGGPAASAAFNSPMGVAVDAAGNVYIADNQNGRIREVTADGRISTYAGVGLPSPNPATSGDGGPAAQAYLGLTMGLAFDAAGNLFVTSNSGIRQITPGGTISTAGGSYPPYFGYAEAAPATSVGISQAGGLAVDPQGRIYFAEPDYYRIRVLQPYSGLKVVNAASNDPTSLPAPGEIVVLYGSNLGPASLVTAAPDASGAYPAQLAGTRILFGAIPAPILYTSANQAAAIVPYEIPVGSNVEAVVEYQGQVAAAQTLSTLTSPGIFTLDSSGKGQAAAVNQDGSINGPSAPAHPGDIISLYATGEGITNPAGVDGRLNSLPLPRPWGAVTATVGGLGATVQYAGGAYGEVAGLMQVNVQIPAGVSTGNSVPVQLYVSGSGSQGGVTIAVR